MRWTGSWKAPQRRIRGSSAKSERSQNWASIRLVYQEGKPGTVLSGSFTLSKYAKAGYWSPDQIRLSDAHSNERFGGINDFGWRLYVNNPLEDVTPPQYVRNSLALSKSTAIREDREVQVIEATWEVVEEDSGIVDCAGYLVVEVPGTSTRRYGRDGYSYRMGGDFPYRSDPQGKSLPGLAHRAALHALGGVYRGVHRHA